MYSHPLKGRTFFDIDCPENLDEAEFDPKTTLAIFICLIGWPFWLIYRFVKNENQEVDYSKNHPAQV